jgi:elongator complex protein 2
VEKAHARIIWDVSVSPMEFGPVFVTGSRDKSIKIWGGKERSCVASVKFVEAVTSCEFLFEIVEGMAFMAVGLENGDIYLVGCEIGTINWRVVHHFDQSYILFQWS